MPPDKSRVDRMINMMDEYLQQREADKLNGYDDDDDDSDPVQFSGPDHHKGPIAEPPAMPQEDSAPSRIHGEGSRRDLFK